MEDSKAVKFEKIQEMISKGQYKEVLPDLKSYLSANKENVLAYKLLGNVYAYTGYLNKARLVWKGALKKFPENTDLLYNMALSGVLSGKPSKIYLKRLLAITPNDSGAISMVAQIAKDSGNYRLAIKYWGKALKIEKDNVELMNNIGVSYAIIGSLGKACLWYKKAIEIDPHYALAYYNLATSQYERGEFSEAMENAEKAIELDPATHMNQATALIRQINKKVS